MAFRQGQQYTAVVVLFLVLIFFGVAYEVFHSTDIEGQLVVDRPMLPPPHAAPHSPRAASHPHTATHHPPSGSKTGHHAPLTAHAVKAASHLEKHPHHHSRGVPYPVLHSRAAGHHPAVLSRSHCYPQQHERHPHYFAADPPASLRVPMALFPSAKGYGEPCKSYIGTVPDRHMGLGHSQANRGTALALAVVLRDSGLCWASAPLDGVKAGFMEPFLCPWGFQPPTRNVSLVLPMVEGAAPPPKIPTLGEAMKRGRVVRVPRFANKDIEQSVLLSTAVAVYNVSRSDDDSGVVVPQWVWEMQSLKGQVVVTDEQKDTYTKSKSPTALVGVGQQQLPPTTHPPPPGHSSPLYYVAASPPHISHALSNGARASHAKHTHKEGGVDLHLKSVKHLHGGVDWWDGSFALRPVGGGGGAAAQVASVLQHDSHSGHNAQASHADPKGRKVSAMDGGSKDGTAHDGASEDQHRTPHHHAEHTSAHANVHGAEQEGHVVNHRGEGVEHLGAKGPHGGSGAAYVKGTHDVEGEGPGGHKGGGSLAMPGDGGGAKQGHKGEHMGRHVGDKTHPHDAHPRGGEHHGGPSPHPHGEGAGHADSHGAHDGGHVGKGKDSLTHPSHHEAHSHREGSDVEPLQHGEGRGRRASAAAEGGKDIPSSKKPVGGKGSIEAKPSGDNDDDDKPPVFVLPARPGPNMYDHCPAAATLRSRYHGCPHNALAVAQGVPWSHKRWNVATHVRVGDAARYPFRLTPPRTTAATVAGIAAAISDADGGSADIHIHIESDSSVTPWRVGAVLMHLGVPPRTACDVSGGLWQEERACGGNIKCDAPLRIDPDMPPQLGMCHGDPAVNPKGGGVKPIPPFEWDGPRGEEEVAHLRPLAPHQPVMLGDRVLGMWLDVNASRTFVQIAAAASDTRYIPHTPLQHPHAKGVRVLVSTRVAGSFKASELALATLATADVVAVSKSGFSHLSGLLNSGIKLAQRFWHAVDCDASWIPYGPEWPIQEVGMLPAAEDCNAWPAWGLVSELFKEYIEVVCAGVRSGAMVGRIHVSLRRGAGR